MAAKQSQTTEDVSCQPIMKIQSTNYQVLGDVDAYPEGLQMFIIALQNFVLSTSMFNSFLVPLSWLSLTGSTTTYSKTMKIVTFQLVNDKKFRLSKKLFAQILNIPNVETFYKVTNEQVIHMYNEMGYQPILTKVSDFKKYGLPCIWNFLFGIYLRCLTSRSVGLDKAHLEVYAMVAGIYYDLQVDYATQIWNDFVKSIGNTNIVDGISCARY